MCFRCGCVFSCVSRIRCCGCCGVLSIGGKQPCGALTSASRYPPEAEANLAREAVARGIDPRRLVFSDRFAQESHLQIKSLCDLYLDTPGYNAHATALDALWAGE
jgi:hypothetical protein